MEIFTYFMGKRFDWVLEATDSSIYLARWMHDLYSSNFENVPES